MSKNIVLINTAADTFLDLYERTNDLIAFIQDEAVSVNSTLGITTGNGYVNGTFGALRFYTSQLRGGNTTTSANLVITSNVHANSNVLIAGNLTVSGNVNFPNFALELSIPPADGSLLGNSTYSWTLYSVNIYNRNGIYTNTISSNVATIGGIIANSSGYYGTAIFANNTTYFGGRLPSYYTNATNITTGTIDTDRLTTATTSGYGITRLSTAIDSTSTGLASTPSATKTAYDRATNAQTSADAANTRAYSAQTAASAANTRAYSAQTAASAANTRAYSAQTAAALADAHAANATYITTGIVDQAHLPRVTIDVNSYGVVRMTSNATLDSDTWAASASACKTAYDRGSSGISIGLAANTRAYNAQTVATNALLQAANATFMSSGTVGRDRLPQASADVNVYGVVRLSSNSSADSETWAATISAVRDVRVLALNAQASADDATSKATAATVSAITNMRLSEEEYHTRSNSEDRPYGGVITQLGQGIYIDGAHWTQIQFYKNGTWYRIAKTSVSAI